MPDTFPSFNVQRKNVPFIAYKTKKIQKNIYDKIFVSGIVYYSVTFPGVKCNASMSYFFK